MAGMSLTLENLREITTTRLQNHPRLATQPFNVDYLINRGIMMLTLVLPDSYRGDLYTTYTEDFVVDQKYYNLPSISGGASSDLLELRHIFINGIYVYEQNVKYMQAMDSNAYMAPVLQYPVYIRLGDRIAAYPQATVLIADGLQWDYIKVPDVLVDDSDVPGLPGMVHYLIPIAATEVLLEMLGQQTDELDRALNRLLRAQSVIVDSEEGTEGEERRTQPKLPFRPRRAE